MLFVTCIPKFRGVRTIKIKLLRDFHRLIYLSKHILGALAFSNHGFAVALMSALSYLCQFRLFLAL
ncbi:hypothetical protein FHR87_001954 [Azomonas macrocytogenes]|uniref:Uncharacterized protein n=1 Tax=Azomonas macrocytogenes TaxID=69962 RepID=A0A839T375_AZOMA|nr:hypothetical protein [Azomonas macrocytogenes]